MSDMTQDQILREFTRQTRLCSGIGRAAMLSIIETQFSGKHDWERTMIGEVCQKCGRGVEAAGKRCEG
jgi:hypothetical protein